MLTGYIGPLRRREGIFSFHDISEHDHLFPVPEWRATDQESKHYNTTGPSVEKLSKFLNKAGKKKFIN